MSRSAVSIKVIRPTGAFIRSTPDALSRTNIVGVATCAQELHGASAQADWWVLQNQRYVQQRDAIAIDDSPALDVAQFNFHPVSQRHTNWANVVLGYSHDPKITIGRQGSWLVVATLLANASQDALLDPIQMNLQHKQINGFYAPGPFGGLPAHFRIDTVTNGRVKLLQMIKRTGSSANIELLAALQAHLDRGQPAMIEVNALNAVAVADGGLANILLPNPIHRDILNSPMHFVLAISSANTREALVTPSSTPKTFVSAAELGQSVKELKIIDPWDGCLKSLCPTYGPDIASAVVRIVLYEINRDGRKLSTATPDQTLANTPPVSLPEYSATPNFGETLPREIGSGNTHLPAPARPMLGVNALWNGSASMDAFNFGCRCFTCVNDPAMGNMLSDLGAMVMSRWVWRKWVPTPELFLRHLGGSRAGVIYLGLEGNEILGDSPDDIRQRAEFDASMARLIREQSRGRARYAAGSFASGSPNYDDPAVCQAIHTGYADAYNRGLFLFNVPTELPAWRGAQSLWDEHSLGYTARRWEFLFKRCGFDPRVRGIVSDRAGLNSDGGGFIKHAASNEAVISFCRRWIEVQARPMLIDPHTDPLMLQRQLPRQLPPCDYDGTWHSPFIGGTLFQLGNDAWQEDAKFDIGSYLNDLGRYLWK